MTDVENKMAKLSGDAQSFTENMQQYATKVTEGDDDDDDGGDEVEILELSDEEDLAPTVPESPRQYRRPRTKLDERMEIKNSAENILLNDLEERFNFSKRLRALDKNIGLLNFDTSNEDSGTPQPIPAGSNEQALFDGVAGRKRPSNSAPAPGVWRRFLNNEVMPWLKNKLAKVPVKRETPPLSPKLETGPLLGKSVLRSVSSRFKA